MNYEDVNLYNDSGRKRVGREQLVFWRRTLQVYKSGWIYKRSSWRMILLRVVSYSNAFIFIYKELNHYMSMIFIYICLISSYSHQELIKSVYDNIASCISHCLIAKLRGHTAYVLLKNSTLLWHTLDIFFLQTVQTTWDFTGIGEETKSKGSA